MLVLTRRIGESLIIGHREIIFYVLGARGNQVRIGIEAPKETAIFRDEVYEKYIAQYGSEPIPPHGKNLIIEHVINGLRVDKR